MTSNDMIKFRERSYSRVDDEVMKDPSLSEVVRLFDKNKETSYGLSLSIPNNSLSITYGDRTRICTVNVPLSLNQFQYDVEDYLIDSRPRIKYSSLVGRNHILFKLRGPMEPKKVYELAQYIVDEIGYVVLTPDKR